MTDIKILASGFGFPEGPVVMPDGAVILTEIRNGRCSRVTPDGKSAVFSECGGGPNGLAIGPVMINAGTYLIWAYVAGLVLFGRPVAQYLDIAGTPYMGELSVFAAAVIGAGVGFLWYNTYPAQVFMGDVGSLALGGGLGMLAILTKNELLSVLVGGIFVLETVSVVTQVFSFKVFGKRVFLMAPIHHHFEKKGWAEPKIIVRFWIISILLALIGLSSLKVR